MARTYIPRLVFLARLLCKYIGRWRNELAANMTEPQIALLDALVAACTALEAAITLTEGN